MLISSNEATRSYRSYRWYNGLWPGKNGSISETSNENVWIPVAIFSGTKKTSILRYIKHLKTMEIPMFSVLPPFSTTFPSIFARGFTALVVATQALPARPWPSPRPRARTLPRRGRRPRCRMRSARSRRPRCGWWRLDRLDLQLWPELYQW